MLSYVVSGLSAMLSVFCYTEFAIEIPVRLALVVAALGRLRPEQLRQAVGPGPRLRLARVAGATGRTSGRGKNRRRRT